MVGKEEKNEQIVETNNLPTQDLKDNEVLINDIKQLLHNQFDEDSKLLSEANATIKREIEEKTAIIKTQISTFSEDLKKTNKAIEDRLVLSEKNLNTEVESIKTNQEKNSLIIKDFLSKQDDYLKTTQNEKIAALDIARKEADEKAIKAEENAKKFWSLYEKEQSDHNETKRQKDADIRQLQAEKIDSENRFNNAMSDCKEKDLVIKTKEEKIEALQKENAAIVISLQSEKNEKENQITKCQQLEAAKHDITEEKNKLNEELLTLTENYNALKSKYESLNIEPLIEAHEKFTSMSAELKKDLSSIIPQESFLGFISSATKWSNIALIWEFAKRNIFNNKMDGITELNDLFCILMNIYNAGLQEPQFELVIPQIGTTYNAAEHAIKEVKTKGTVCEVYLAGYRNIKDGNLHKAVISVND